MEKHERLCILNINKTEVLESFGELCYSLEVNKADNIAQGIGPQKTSITYIMNVLYIVCDINFKLKQERNMFILYAT